MIFWDRNQPLQDLVDTWDQACSVLNDNIPVRLVGPGGNMNHDFPLRYFTRSNSEGRQMLQSTSLLVSEEVETLMPS